MKKFTKLNENITLNSFGNTLITINSEDWEGIYINGNLATEGHSLNFHNFLDYCQLNEICFGEITRYHTNNEMDIPISLVHI